MKRILKSKAFIYVFFILVFCAVAILREISKKNDPQIGPPEVDSSEFKNLNKGDFPSKGIEL